MSAENPLPGNAHAAMVGTYKDKINNDAPAPKITKLMVGVMQVDATLAVAEELAKLTAAISRPAPAAEEPPASTNFMVESVPVKSLQVGDTVMVPMKVRFIDSVSGILRASTTERGNWGTGPDSNSEPVTAYHCAGLAAYRPVVDE